jgi:hypothetical protein
LLNGHLLEPEKLTLLYSMFGRNTMAYRCLGPIKRYRKLIVVAIWVLFIFTAGSSAGIINLAHGQTTSQAQQVYTNNLVIYVTLYGINSTTGDVIAFVNAHGLTQTKAFNATKLDMMDNKTNGIAQTSFFFQNLTLRAGEQFNTCVVIPSSAKMICQTDNKTPFPRPQFVDISIR